MTATTTDHPIIARILAEQEAQRQRLAEIRRGLELLHEPGAVFEVRAVDVPSGRGGWTQTVAGWFNDFDKAAAAILSLDAEKPPGVYLTLNSCNPALLARSPNKLQVKPKLTTSDQDIDRRRWLFIDIDPHRPAGICATSEEKATAELLAGDIAEKLRGFGFPWPMVMDSGNGQYLLYRVDLPNDTDTTATVKTFYSGLNAIAGRIDTSGPYADIDSSVYNAARIARVPATWNRKGADTPDRPHRQAVLTDPGEPLEIVPIAAIEAVAALAPSPPSLSSGRPGSNSQQGNGRRLDVPRYLQAHGISFKTKALPNATAYLVQCPFNPSHGRNGECAVVQADSGLLTFECKHNECQGRRWADFRDAIGKPDQAHYDGQPALRTFREGGRVRAKDRGNIGTVVSDNGNICEVQFVNPHDGNTAIKSMAKSDLEPLDGTAAEHEELPLSPPLSLRKIVAEHPRLRPAVIHRLLRAGETANLVASPKAGKSWLGNALALSVATGREWLDTFACEPGNVLVIDAELHPEVIAHRLPMVADAMGIAPSEYLDKIDIWALRGIGLDLLSLGRSLDTIERDRYSLVVLDAWYRFLPPGISENDNAQVMALYNAIDRYANRLGATWVNIHHASKGDQATKGVTDVGAGAGSQSRAADTHLIIRPHEQEGVAVLEAVVRSFPPVERLAIRWEFPLWTLATDADPRRLLDSQTARDRARREKTESRLDTDRKFIVEAMRKFPAGESKTAISNACGMSRERFGPALASLIQDGNVIAVPILKSGKKTPIEGYKLCEE